MPVADLKRCSVAKVTVELAGEIPDVVPNDRIKVIDLRSLNEEQKNYFRNARVDFLRGIGWWKFANIHFSAMSKLYDLVPERGEEFYRTTLYLAIKELWLSLGVNNGEVKATLDTAVYIVI